MAEWHARCVLIDGNPDMHDLVRQLVKPINLKFEGYTRPRDFLRDFKTHGPGVIVSDLIMPEMTGIELLHSVQIQQVPMPFILVTGFADIDAAVSAFRAGAFDFIEKPFSKSSFIATMQRAITHSRFMLTAHERRRDIKILASRLTNREAAVLWNMVAGASNKETARKLGISHRTVEHHRQHGLKKLGVRSVMDLGTTEWRDALNTSAPPDFDFPAPGFVITDCDGTSFMSRWPSSYGASSRFDSANSNASPAFSA